VKAVVQRVHSANVVINGEKKAEIGRGLLVYLGVGQQDTEKDVDFFVNKIINLRIFPDEDNKMNISALLLNLEILVVSQFTLYGDVKKGFRPSFQDAADTELAIYLYELFIRKLKETGLKIATGTFQAMMDIHSVNDGPVTIII